MTKKKQNKLTPEQEKVEAEGRMATFNTEMTALAKKYQVKLDINQRIVVIDDKPKKTSK